MEKLFEDNKIEVESFASNKGDHVSIHDTSKLSSFEKVPNTSLFEISQTESQSESKSEKNGHAAIDSKLSSLISFRAPQEKIAKYSLDPNDPDYKMDHKRRGKCIIFNHRYFKCPNLNERKGTEVDCKILIETFTKLGFHVDTYDDSTIHELKAVLKAVSNDDHKDADCFVCCVLTHGEMNFLWAKDERYCVDLLFIPFKADNCPTLAGKPKLFFIQACRGDQLDSGMKVCMGHDVPDSSTICCIPTWADFLMAYSCVPGYYSWRNTSNGSWFIQSLTTVLSKEGDKNSLIELLVKVCHKVAYEYESCTPQSKIFDKQKQIPSFTSMLTRRIVFTPKTKAT